MRFLPTDEQVAFGEAIDEIVTDHGGADIAQQWAAGDSAAGLSLWRTFAEMGLTGLRVSEADGGFGGSLGDLVVVFERLGYHGAPGPYLESVSLLPALVDPETRRDLAGGAIGTASVAGIAPAALDADVATHLFALDGDTIRRATIARSVDSLAPTRRLSLLAPEGETRDLPAGMRHRALNEASLAAAALLLGSGERLLREAVAYAGLREQFGRPIGEFQALKHQLADVRVALTFARPLLWNAALEAADGDGDRAVSAAKVAASDAARLAARIALQVHGAIGYTAEHHLRIWLGLAPALAGVWGTPAAHRARIARTLLSSDTI
ncbi:acyl-CoA/acyl-ACP dehydrogenase [Microbacterium sp. zg.Y1090]|uniref:acyl-CoA dehydrogenase family protein n=1 Tax=Microbacterium TaxID=33882 RepID=UPI00214CA206|nr:MULTISPECIES: acyl-CoA dehydrogenase family protein [unclassified Microbacterium]MCR2813329.1 acyl-CoA/acyl-ACP dehydrogenase [Microbacterium sp. zg.Y1084]MCR2819837.1 acyl-CoA/acyl-ACP dehydrogenase [Microbacterium sp. zg.Y1090]MDL5487948.1 acyl-CoA dehydrogenase family protein [Microbacterium sp. zg-Y1211]WIM28606.1 acyl-CoA dehydrogenase family protein [Microbacterium sp. zg-Y1090]